MIDATYVTQTTDPTLTNEQSLGALTTGLLLNTASAGTGVLSQYAGTSCTNQFPRSLSNSGAATCSSVALAADVSGTLPNGNTTATSANTASAIVARDGSGNFSAGTITGTLSGNASTATALAANPSDCGSNQYATTIAANGDLTCSAVTFDQIGSGSNVSATMVVGTGGSLTTTGSGTINATRSGTADALFSNPTDCGSNQFATTIAANGNLTCAQPAFSDISGTAAATQITKINAGVGTGGCQAGTQTANDGTVSCLTAPATPEFLARVETAGGSISAYAVVTANGSNDDEVVEAATTVTQILGCSQSGATVTSTNPVTVAMGGVARCKADATVTAGSLVKLGATGEFSLATTAEKTWGRAVTDDDGAGSAYILLFDGAEGYIDHALNLWPNVPDFSASAMEVIEFNPDLDLGGVAQFHSVLHVDPVIHIGQTGSVLGSIAVVSTQGMSVLHDDSTATAGNLPGIQLFWAFHDITTSVAVPAPDSYTVLDGTSKISTGAITVPSGGTHRTIDSGPVFKAISGATSTTAEATGLYFHPTAGTDNGASDGTAVTVTEANAVKVANGATDAGAGTETYTEYNGVNCAALTAGTTTSCIKSAVTQSSGRFFLNDTGGADSKFTGEITTYDNVAKATNENGAAFTVYSTSATAQGANIGSTNLIASATAGRYQICSMVTVTRAATSSSTMPSSAIGWTDVTDSNTKALTVTPTNAANSTATAESNCILADVKGSTAITYATASYATSGATSMQYKIYITATRL